MLGQRAGEESADDARSSARPRHVPGVFMPTAEGDAAALLPLVCCGVVAGTCRVWGGVDESVRFKNPPDASATTACERLLLPTCC